MPLPRCPAKYNSRAIITARQAIEAGRQSAPPDCPPDLMDACRRALTAAEVEPVSGGSWTTDAPFRETEAEVREMQAAGVLAVEMELAAVYAAAQVRGVAAAGLCVVSDALSELVWRPHFRDPHVMKRLRDVFDVTADMLARSSAGALPPARHVGQTS